MPTPQPHRSTYRDRRINVMLQESLDATPQVSAPAANTPATGEAPKVKNTSRRSLLSIFLGITALCAVVMFFVLSRHDTSQLAKNVPSQPVSVAPVKAPAVVAPRAEVTSPVVPTPRPVAPIVPERVHFKLKRSGRPQSIGGLSLRLLNTNAKKGVCSLLISSAQARQSQRTVQMNRSIEIPIQNGNAVALLVSGISKDSVSGYITERSN